MARAAAVEGTTRVVGIFGDPVDHSLSPRMHNAAYAELGLDYVYVPLHTTESHLRRAVRAIHVLDLAGANVTIPFKRRVMRYLQRVTKTAAAIGAVNTVYCDGKGLVGDNTDAPGIVAALSANGFHPRRKRILIIGAGGSARAAVYALAEAGAADIVIANRTLAKARRLARAFEAHKDKLAVAPLDALEDPDFLDTRQLVINCTPVGMKGKTYLDYDVASSASDCLHFDLAYADGPTPFLAAAAAEKRPTLDGRHLLVHQGALSFKIFTGRRAPVEVMAKAIGIKPAKK